MTVQQFLEAVQRAAPRDATVECHAEFKTPDGQEFMKPAGWGLELHTNTETGEKRLILTVDLNSVVDVMISRKPEPTPKEHVN